MTAQPERCLRFSVEIRLNAHGATARGGRRAWLAGNLRLHLRLVAPSSPDWPAQAVRPCAARKLNLIKLSLMALFGCHSEEDF